MLIVLQTKYGEKLFISGKKLPVGDVYEIPRLPRLSRIGGTPTIPTGSHRVLKHLGMKKHDGLVYSWETILVE